MNIELKKKPKNVTIIEGFPGFGLIGTITTEFLIDNLKAELIGTIHFDEIPTMVAIHDGKLVNPIGIFYSKPHNLVIMHVITSVAGIEWKLAKAISEVAKQLTAKEVISLEGVASPIAGGAAMPGGSGSKSEAKCFYYTNSPKLGAKLAKARVEPLKEGIIIGVTGALLIKEKLTLSCIFAETSTGLPDSKAAAEIIKVLDKYLGMDMDPKPLLDQAEKFEQKLQSLMSQTKNAQDTQRKKSLSYVG